MKNIAGKIIHIENNFAGLFYVLRQIWLCIEEKRLAQKLQQYYSENMAIRNIAKSK